MIKIKDNKFIVFFMLTIMLVHTLFSPVLSLASVEIHNKQVNLNDTSFKSGIVVAEHDKEIPLYKSKEVDSEVLITLFDQDEVKVLEIDDKYSLIEVIVNDEHEQDEDVVDSELERWQGYIENEFLQIVEEEVENDDESDSIDDSNSDSSNELEEDSSLEEDNVDLNDSGELEEMEEIEKSDDLDKQENQDVEKETQVDISKDKDNEMRITTFRSTAKNITGVAKKSPTNVRVEPSTKVKVIKKLPIGAVIEYQSYSNDWNQITVDVNGKKEVGYIHKKHVTNVKTIPEDLKGVAKKSPTNIRAGASTKSKVLKKLPIGAVVEYQTFSKNWNQITVVVNGKKEVGYLHKKHVTNVNTVPEDLKGVAKKSPTNIRAGASTKSKVLKKLPIGAVVEYQTFSKNWNQITVDVNGKKEVGYLHKKHVTNVNTIPKAVTVVTTKSPTNVRAGASTKAKVIKKFSYGSVINVKTFSKNWYEITTEVNGVNTKGYIHKKHVGTNAIKETKYNIGLNAALNIQTGGKSTIHSPSTMYVVREALSQNKNGVWVINGKDWDVKSAPNSTSKTLGKIDGSYTQGTITVDTKNSTKNYYKFNVTSIIANKDDVKKYLNPNNFAEGSNDYYQFLVLSQSAGTEAKDVNNKILTKSKGILAGKASSFIQAAKEHKVNELYLISHSILETGHGSSKLAKGLDVGLNKKGDPELVTAKNKSELTKIKTVYNMYGIGAINANANKYGAERAYKEGWTTPEKAIIGGAKFIGENYISKGQDTLYKMRWHPQGMVDLGSGSWHQYATDVAWASKQTSNLIQYYRVLDNYTLSFDVPSYK